MKTLDLSIELSNLAFEATEHPMSKGELLGKVKSTLSRHSGILGRLTGIGKQQKVLGEDLRLSEHRFDYEAHSIQVHLANFKPRGSWEVQDIKLL